MIQPEITPDEISGGSAKVLLRTCAGLSKGERLLIAYDDSKDYRSTLLEKAAKSLGADVTSGQISDPVAREPPRDIASKMLQNDVTIFVVNEPRTMLWGHADAKVAAISKGARVLFLTQEIESTPDENSLLAIRDRSNRLAEILEKASKATLVTSGGKYELNLELVGRKALRLSSILSKPGSWGAVPDYAEAGVAPLESGTNGDLRVDGMIIGLGKISTPPVDLHFESGMLTRIDGGELGRRFGDMLVEPSSRVLCELGFGTNHLRREVRGEFDDKKALGTVHIAVGDNHTLGGNNRASVHIDCLTLRPEVLIDGRHLDLTAF